jgi:hypothetical protein
MKIICPNLKNEEVAREFEELKNATSEAAAYHIWSQNNGNGIDKAPNGEPSNLFSDLLEHYNGDRVAAIQAKARTYSKSFKEWFGDWTGNVSIDIDSKDAIDYLYSTNTELYKVGSKEEYTQYVNSIYPNSLINSIYWHGTDSDLSQGIENTKKGKGSGAPETGAEMYFNKQPWASLQYLSGVNRNIPDTEGYNNWVKLWWELKEALGNGRMDTDEWKNEIIGPNTRQYSPNKRGIFNRDKGGSNGKYLSERKARYGYQDKTDKEFFEEVFDIRYGKETFNDWVNRKKSEFQNVWKSRQVKKGMYPAVLNIQNPIVEKNQNTYYEEQRGLFTKAKRDKNDAIVSNEANNEFGSDVVVIFNPKENVHFLGTKQDIENFKNWKSSNKDKTNVSKVVDENGEPLLVWHGTTENFDVFSKSWRGATDPGDWGLGFYFSPKKSSSEMYGNILMPVFLSIKNPVPNEKFQMINSFGREKVKPITLKEKIQEDIKTTKFTIKGIEEQLYGNDPDYELYRKEGSLQNIMHKKNLERYKDKLKDLQTQLQTKSKEELDYDINKKWNDNIEDINKYDGVIPNINSGKAIKENYEIVAREPNQIKSIDNQGTFSTKDNNIYLADSNSENISQLESMQSYSNSKELLDNMNSEMATVLNDVASKINMQPVSIEYTDRPLNEVYPEATYWTPAIYDRNSNTIVVNRNGDFSRYGSLENVLLHEIAHAITLDSLASNTEAANELRKIQKEYAEKHDDHASKNVYEFAAELFSNPEVIHNMFDFPATKGEKTLIQRIIDWFKRLFGKNTTHQDLINKIVDNVIEFNAYQTLEQREDSYDYIPDVLPAASKREEIASIKLRSVFSDMVKTAENRMASLRYNVIEDKFDRNENLRNNKLLSSLRSIQNSITDVEGINNITNFLNGSLEYVDNVIYSLDEAERVIKTIDEKISTAQITNDTEELTKLRTALDNFGAEYLYPHESNLRKLYNELNTEFNRNIYENILGTNEFDNILSIVDGLIREFSSKKMVDRENIGYMYGNSVRRTVEKFLRTEMEEAKDPNIDRALMNWLTFDGDLNWYHRFFATPVNSPKFVIKLLRKVIGDVNSMTHKQVYRKYSELYKAAKETRDHNLLFERDVDGKKTGYLIRDRRYGVYQNNKYKFRKDWLKNHKLASIDELKLNPSLWIQYQKDYNDWKSENCERKYTPEFYAIFTNLSMEANMALSEVNLEIDNILKPYRDSNTNKPRFERMPIDEYQKYIRLLEKKRNLANPYDPITGELKPEGSVEAQIAAELTEAYAKLQEGLESKVDMDAFLEEMERMKNMEGYTPDGSDTLYSAWLERNTRWELTDEFKEKVSRQNKKDYGEIYDRLYQARYNLLRLYRTDKFEPDYTRMPQAVKDKIKELDIAMYNVRKRTKKTASSVRLFKSELSDIAKENGGKSAVSSEDIWVDDKGVKHYASYMTKVIPVRQQYMHRVPNSNWAETSEESKFYNKNYDNSIPEAEQPKLSIKEYDNRKAYNAVMRDPALVNLRNVILDVMNEANDKITHSNYKNNYKLPQINGNIFNYWGGRGLITGTRNYMIDAFGIQPDDEIHGVKVETRPNGTEINIMPTMYTTMLTDPASGTNDLIGAIVKYYRMACNYENKKKVAPQLNLLDSLITNAGSIRQKGFTKPAASSKLADAVHTYIGYHIYGRRDILPEVTLKGYKISLDKVFEHFSRWGRDIGLSWNLRSAISGGVAAWSFYANDAFVRKHYNMHDFTIANGILTKELISLKAASQFGKNQANNKLIGALEYNGLTFNQEEDLSNTNRWRIGRMITRAAEPYSAFKLMSFLPNSAFTVSVYLNYKLIRLEDGQLHFISENDFLDNHFLNKSIEERKAMYRNAKDNLWNAYEMKDGFRVKSKYAPYVTAELEEEITAKLGSISSHAEGMVEEADKSGVHLLPALSTILMFRAFIPKNIENTISPMYWNYQTKELSMGTASAYFYGWKYGSDRNLIKLLRVLTGRNDEKLKELQEQYPDVDVKKQIDLHIRRFNAQIFTYFFWLTIFNLFGMGADDDDYWFTQFLRLELKKISLESGSRYNAMDIFDILNSITPLTQTFEDINRVINPLSYLSSRKYEEIERGAYKGLKGWQRDFIKVIPILNAYYNMKNPREKLNDMINRIG